MAAREPAVDAYIAASAAFAQPILTCLHERLHATCPEREEGLKWRMPFSSYRGAPMCMMAVFKQHAGFGLWPSTKVVTDAIDDGMGQFGKLPSVQDLPSKQQLTAYIRKAMALNDACVKLAHRKPAAKPAPAIPGDLAALLAQKKHAAGRKTHAVFSPAAQRECIDWTGEAKTDATRQKRIASTLAWLAEGKHRNWKYEKC